MPPSSGEGPGEVRRAHGSGAHTLLVADTGQVRARTLDWVRHELSGGAKVVYKGWFGPDRDPDRHWLLGPGGVPDARERGQLDLLDFRTVVERCDGSSDGLFRLQCDEVRTAMTAGWSSVAMTQETTYRPMADDEEVAEFAEQEHGYERLAQQWPLNTLCQIALDAECPDAVRESVAVHHHDLHAGRWSARTDGGCWRLAGELDVAVATEFGAAVRGAVEADGTRAARSPLHVDLGDVSFMDSVCARTLLGAARSSSRRRRLVLHRPSTMVRDLLAAVGVPRSVELGAPS